MDALSRAAPPPGSASPGDLYVDFQTRTLWLGVDPVVEPDEFVLISDIIALQAEIDGAIITSKDYTDTEILTRAPSVHTHNASQITNFTAAVQAVIAATPSATINRGLIAMFSGSLAEIGIGDWAGWSLCDGGNGTPDLRDKFIIGAGNKPVGNKNTPVNFKTDVQGGHTHTVNVLGHQLSVAEMPGHNHAGNTGTVSSDHQHYQGGTFGTSGRSAAHTHGPGGSATTFKGARFPTAQAYSTPAQANSTGPSDFSATGAESVDHSHTVTIGGLTGGITANHTHAIPAEGGWQEHTHGSSINTTGSHDHTITAMQIRETVPYYALAFVMKL